MALVDDVSVADKPRKAAYALADKFSLNEWCTLCGVRYTLGLILGDESFAVGVNVCQQCGYQSSVLISDMGDYDGDDAQKLIMAATEWVPSWHPGDADVTPDWRCTCGETWVDQSSATAHIDENHPNHQQLSHIDHDRYPWLST